MNAFVQQLLDHCEHHREQRSGRRQQRREQQQPEAIMQVSGPLRALFSPRDLIAPYLGREFGLNARTSISVPAELNWSAQQAGGCLVLTLDPRPVIRFKAFVFSGEIEVKAISISFDLITVELVGFPDFKARLQW